MSRSHDIPSDVQDLIAASAEDRLTNEEQVRLEQLLADDHQMTEWYIDYLQLQSDLYLLAHQRRSLSDCEQQFVSFDAKNAVALSMAKHYNKSSEADEASEVIIEVEPASLSRRIKRYDSIHWQRHKIRFNAMTAVLTALAWIGFSYFVWFSTTPDDSRPKPVGEDFDFVAYISGVHEHEWAEEMRAMAPNSSMAASERLQLAEGLIEITFYDGAVVVLEAPAEFVIESSGAGTLEVGKLTARVPQRAIGFVIETPSAEIVDLGTEFGAHVDEHGRTEVHLFEGRVELAAKGSDGSVRERVLMESGDAVAVEHSGRIRTVAARDGLFVSSIPVWSPGTTETVTAETVTAGTVLTFVGAGTVNESTILDGYGDNVTSATMGTFGYLGANGFTPNVVVDFIEASGNYMFYQDETWTGDVGYLKGANDRNFDTIFTPDAGYGVLVNSFAFDNHGWSGHKMYWWVYKDSVDPGNILASGVSTVPSPAAGVELTVPTNLSEFHEGTVILRVTRDPSVAPDGGNNIAIDNIHFEQSLLLLPDDTGTPND